VGSERTMEALVERLWLAIAHKGSLVCHRIDQVG
jgi:hypothetical protein